MVKNNFLGSTDLAKRWGITRQAVDNRRVRHDDFPEPTFRIGQNRAPVYSLANVEKYEKSRGIKIRKGHDTNGKSNDQD